MDQGIPSVGVRISHSGHLGTIRYVGPVDNTHGLWLGVEWDSPDRGKHDGSKDGKQYFACGSKTAGSFIRPTANINYGISFLEALTSKYIEALHGSEVQETVTLGSSQGAIQVEAVSLDKIREKFARLDRLREISLNNANIVRADPQGSISKTCPNVRGLDLSQNLLPTWESVAAITRELHQLQRLSVNRNRLEMPTSYDHLTDAFPRLKEIQLNDTRLTWTDMKSITACMPQLEAIEMGYNQLSRLADVTFSTPYNTTVLFLNLDTNLISDWVHICASLKEYQSLQRVALTANSIQNIPFPKSPSDSLPGIKYLSLSDNHVGGWDSVDALSCWCPTLETLTFAGNPLVNDTNLGNQSRSLLIARIPSLKILDGATISPRERTDSELFYMSTIMQQGIVPDEVRSKSHYHWNSLCIKHGKPDEVRSHHQPQNKLSNQLIDIQLYRDEDSMERDEPEAILRVLPTMSLRILRIKICKLLKHDARHTDLTIWLRMGQGTLAKLDREHDARDIDWLGIERGSKVVYRVQEHK